MTTGMPLAPHLNLVKYHLKGSSRFLVVVVGWWVLDFVVPVPSIFPNMTCIINGQFESTGMRIQVKD